ncbi:MAG TPA: TIGR03435 family protein [Terriglobales bacterium]|nr:TIGR03435 family protein [Terriglobales bacterium]
MNRVLAVAIVTAIISALACAQASTKFDVVSIKPTDMRGFRGPLCDDRGSDPSVYVARNCPLLYLVTRAYGFPAARILGVEAWMKGEYFTVHASAAGKPDRSTQDQMLRALLADRFELQVHEATRAVKGFVMTAASDRKLQPPSHPDHVPLVGVFREGDARSPAVSYGFRGDNATLAMLAQRLEPTLGPVEDRTGLTGHYDFVVRYTDRTQDLGLYPAVIPALQQQLGLKLTPAQVTQTVLVIDHAARPTAN